MLSKIVCCFDWNMSEMGEKKWIAFVVKSHKKQFWRVEKFKHCFEEPEEELQMF